MFNNRIKTTLRNLRKGKGFHVLNIAGLAIGIACAALIFLWVEDEVNWDSMHAKKDRLYFVRVNNIYKTSITTGYSTPGVLAPAMQKEIPGIANICRVTEDQDRELFAIGDKSMYADGRYAESSIFSLFTLPFVAGNATNAFAELYSVVLTQKTAHKFFGNDIKDYNTLIGKTIRVNNNQDYVVSAILKDNPTNSSMQFEWLMPFKIYYDRNDWVREWNNNCVSTYVELNTGVSMASVNKPLYNMVQQRVPTNEGHCLLQPMSDWRLYNKYENGKPTREGRIAYVRLFSIIAWIILFIACINFMNLTTARSEKRAREVGVRKVLGAGKKGLVFQFIGEAVFLAFIAALIGVVIVALVLPGFNNLVQKELSTGLNNPLHLFAIVTITLICGLAAGSYPALYLSSFRPVFVLKGTRIKTGSAAFIRKGLVVLQFSISVILIISTLIVYLQLNYVRNRELGFDRKNLVELPMHGELSRNYYVIQQELLRTGMIENVTVTDHTTINGGNNTGDISWQGKTPGSKVLISTRSVTPEFIKTMGMKMVEGRDFITSDTVNLEVNHSVFNAVITKSLAKLMGEGSPIGKKLFDEPGHNVEATIVGVVDDYVYGNMYGTPDPVLFTSLPPRFMNVMYVRIRPSAPTEKVLGSLETVMKKYNPAYPFQYTFVDDQFNGRFNNEMLIGQLSRFFAALAIIISCLGLFGLAAYTAERRTKEIGIRKVLGASVSGLASLLSKEFLQLVVLSCLIAFPIAWWIMNNWLQGFTYRTAIHWWIFVLAGCAAVLIALFTVSFQAIKAAIANPVKSLRTE